MNLNTFWMHGMRCRDRLNQQIFKSRVHMVISLFISWKRFKKKQKKNIYLWMSRHFQISHSKRHHTGSSAICCLPALFSCRKPAVVVIFFPHYHGQIVYQDKFHSVLDRMLDVRGKKNQQHFVQFFVVRLNSFPPSFSATILQSSLFWPPTPHAHTDEQTQLLSFL